jgi:hypothetical protein
MLLPSFKKLRCAYASASIAAIAPKTSAIGLWSEPAPLSDGAAVEDGVPEAEAERLRVDEAERDADAEADADSEAEAEAEADALAEAEAEAEAEADALAEALATPVPPETAKGRV